MLENIKSEYEFGNPDEADFIQLEDNAKIGIQIPEALITDIDCDIMRIAIYSYCFIRRGRDDIFYFSIDIILNWMHKQSNRHKGGINDRIISLLEYFKKQKYISYSDDMLNTTNKQLFGIKFLSKELQKKIDGYSYAYLFWDEVLKIIQYQNSKKKDAYVDNTSALLLFAYLKLKIKKRPNKRKEESKSENIIEAWDGNFIDISNDTGLSVKKISECIKILLELDLIYYERLPASKISESEYRTGHGIFAYTYKRDNGKLIIAGEKYYLNEVRKKKEKLKLKTKIK